MRRIEVRRGSVTLSCLVAGDGDRPVVVLLHGLAGSARELVPTTAALVADHRVVVPDQRGHGHSTRRPADTSRRAYVEDVLAVADAFAPDQPIDLVGQSMGAHTALLVAAERPDQVRRLVLLEGGVGGGDPSHPTRLRDWFASWPVPFPDRDTAARFLGSTPTARSWADDLEERADGLWPRFDADVMAAAIAGVTEVAQWARWRQVSAPTLLVLAERSVVEAAEVRRMLAQRPDVAHVVLPGAGHDAHLDQPAMWTQLLRGFLAG